MLPKRGTPTRSGVVVQRAMGTAVVQGTNALPFLSNNAAGGGGPLQAGGGWANDADDDVDDAGAVDAAFLADFGMGGGLAFPLRHNENTLRRDCARCPLQL